MAAKIFLNVYTIQKEWDTDPVGMLSEIKKMGYEGLEFSLNMEDALFEEVVAEMGRLGLQAVSTHIEIDDFIFRTDYYFNRARKLGITNLVIPWLAENRVPGGADYAATKDKIRQLAILCASKEFALSYHNHDFEFKKIDGECKEDILLRDIPQMNAQLDVCWCTVGGSKPKDYIRRYGHRMPTLHLKDFSVKGDVAGAKLFDLLGETAAADAAKTREKHGFSFQPIGLGQVDFPAIFKAADEAGVQWMLVEQDASPDRPPLEAARLSIEYIKANYKGA